MRALPSAVVALGTLFATVDPAFAVCSVYVEVYAGAGEYDIEQDEQTSDSSPPNESFSLSDPVLGVSLSHIESRVAGSGTAFSSGSAIANPGGVHVATNVSGAGSASPTRESSGGGRTDVQAAMGDSFVLLVPTLPVGTPITVTANWYTSGALFAGRNVSNDGTSSATAYSNWYANFALISSGGEAAYAYRTAGCQDDTVAQQCYGNDFGTEPATVTVANGSLVTVSISARARVNGGASQSGGSGSASMNAFANLGDTVAWGGITSVKDSEGNELSGYTATSAETGFDYRYAYAPEPAAAALAGAAVAALVAVARARARRAAPSS